LAVILFLMRKTSLIRITKAWSAQFFQMTMRSILLYGLLPGLFKLENKLGGTYTKMLQGVPNLPWQEHAIK